jgi:hypothetical protein
MDDSMHRLALRHRSIKLRPNTLGNPSLDPAISGTAGFPLSSHESLPESRDFPSGFPFHYRRQVMTPPPDLPPDILARSISPEDLPDPPRSLALLGPEGSGVDHDRREPVKAGSWKPEA